MRVWLPAVAMVAVFALLPGGDQALAEAVVQRSDMPRAADADASRKAAARALNEGRYAQVDELLKSVAADDPAAAVLRARAALATGEDQTALTLLKRAADGHPGSDAQLELGLLLMRLRRKQEATSLLAPLAAAPQAPKPGDLLRAARAARALGDYEQANEYFRQAVGQDASDASVNIAWGQLFLEKYNRAEAKRSFEAAIAADDRSVDALVGLARAVSEDDMATALASVQHALEINPASADGNVLLAELMLDAGYPDAAVTATGRALAVNPRCLDAHAINAAVARLANRQADFDQAIARVLAIDRNYGEGYRIVASDLAAHYRFDEAVELARKAVALDPDNTRARAELGMDLMRTGDEDGARAELAKAFDVDRYDVVTYNLLAVLDALKTFETVRDGDLVLRVDRPEAAVLAEPALALAKTALADLSARYGFAVKGPILIEIFPHHDDFAVRNLGIPGLVGALGACFGRVVTMDSPKARTPGAFEWQATLWHELTHVVTLQMSAQRVPRWLTEGISVYEEQRTRPEWRRPMEAYMARTLDRVPALKDIESSFTDPKTIAFAYYHAGLVVRYLVETYGQAKFNALVASFADGRTADNAFATSLGAGLDRVQSGFAQWLQTLFGPLKAALADVAGVSLADASIDDLKRLAAEHPGSYSVQLALGSALTKAGDEDAARRALGKAASLYPTAAGPDSPHALLAELALSHGDNATALAEMEQRLRQDSLDVDLARRMAAVMGKDERPERRRLVYERIVALDPFDADAHAALGRMALAQADAAAALREFKAAVAAGPNDAAAARCDLAEAYLLAGDPAQAKKQTLLALEQTPTYERAQELLLKIVEGGR